MDGVDILLFCVVGFSVLVFSIIGYVEERRKNCSRVDIYDYEEEEKNVGGDGGTEKQIFKSGLISDNTENNGEKEEEFIDDWEGIERTELEKVFGEAVVFVSCECNDDDQIHEDVKLELYGLSKIALEGPCYGSQPMALKVSARSKWNAWQKLGNMSRETAMETYIDILSKAIPGWKGENAAASEYLTFTPENT